MFNRQFNYYRARVIDDVRVRGRKRPFWNV